MRQEMRAAVKQQFDDRHRRPKPRAVDALADVGAGHMTAQGGWLPLDPSPETMRRLVAAELVRRYLEGERPSEPIKNAHRHIFAANVNVLLADEIEHGKLAAGDVDNNIRAALASLALGTWDESDFRFLRTLVPGFVVAYYALGTQQV